MFSFNFEKQIPYVKRKGIMGYLTLAAENISDLLALDFIFVLCCLPVITSGAAYCALCDLCLSVSKDEVTYIYRRYFSSFKKHLLKGSLLGAICALVLFIIAFSFVFYLHLTQKSFLFYPLCAVCISCFICTVCAFGQAFAIYASGNFGILESIKQGFIFSFAHIKQSSLYFLLFMLLFFPVFAFFPYTVVAAVFPWSFLCLSSCFIFTQRGGKLM